MGAQQTSDERGEIDGGEGLTKRGIEEKKRERYLHAANTHRMLNTASMRGPTSKMPKAPMKTMKNTNFEVKNEGEGTWDET